MAAVRCPVCGQTGNACGGRTAAVPVDELLTLEVPAVGKLGMYTVTTQNGVETVMQLTEAHAKQLGAVPVAEPDAPQVANKARQPGGRARPADTTQR